jgi:hypothetical protein
MIDTSTWKEFHLYDIFDIDMGNKMDRGKMSDGTIAFVGRTANNNGINARVGKVIDHEKYGTIEPYEKGCITLALGGSIGSCFIQEEPFYTSQNVAVLMPKISHSDYALRFITSVITHSVLHGKYEAFTEELNKHIKTDFVVSLPATSDGQPDWDYMESYMKAVMEESEKSLENLKIGGGSLHEKEFRVGDLFDIHPTKAYKLTNAQLLDNGEYPVIANSAYNNGIGGYSTKEPTEKGNMVTFSDTVDANTIFYQPNDFVGYPHVQGLYPLMYDDKWNEYTYSFFVSVFRGSAISKGFDYGNKFRRDIAVDLIIKLPATSDGQPDWDYMESYMKAVMEESEKSLENLKKTDDTKHLIDTSAWGEFRIGDLFEEVKAGYIGSAKKIGTATKSPDADHTLPLTCAKYGNCGIMYYGRESDYIICENVLAVIRDGAVSTGMVYAEERASVYSHSYFIKVKNIDVSFLTNQYLSCVLTKNIYPRYYRDDTCIWDRIKDDNIKLPITSTGKPDWQYMEDYMRSIMDKSEQIISDLQIGK